MKTAFPKYDYEDMVDARYRLVKEGLGIKHLRLVIGNSMGGMHAWIWGVKYPQFMDALVPMASQPTEMAARNWMLRRMMLETIRNDPDYNNGDYTTQPRFMKIASIFFGIATAGGTLKAVIYPEKLLGDRDEREQYDPTSIINEVRSDVEAWRSLPNPNQWQVTPETTRLLQHWRHHKFNDCAPVFLSSRSCGNCDLAHRGRSSIQEREASS